MTESLPCRREAESAHFGIEVFSADVLTAESVRHLREAMPADAPSLLVLRVNANAIEAIHAIERMGGVHCDTLVGYERTATTASPGPAPQRVIVRPVRASDEPVVAALADAAFGGFVGHWHADPMIFEGAARSLYTKWARRLALVKEEEITVIAHGPDDEMLGFLAMAPSGMSTWNVPLTAVLPAARGRGILGSMLHEAMRLARDRGATRFEYETQLRNRAASRAVVRCGFLPDLARHTFHLWSGPR